MTLTHLPAQLTSFVGRRQELLEVERLASSSRLVTLTGASGCGKTRLAVQAAHALSETFADGVWLVELASLHDAALVPDFVAQALGVHQFPDQPLVESLLSFVRSKHMLLVLDNCEHLSAACAELAQTLLSHSSQLNILATSREPLAVLGESLYPVSPLALPPGLESSLAPGVQNSAPSLEEVSGYDAIQLFAERARAILPEFALTSNNAVPILNICRRLDGIPLAIELASARANVLTVDQIAERLRDRFALLTAGQRAARVPHHHTMRAAIDWSYDLITPEEQTFLRRLAVFEGGFTLDTAEAVCAGEGIAPKRTLDVLSSLVNKSLVVATTLGRAEGRYRLLETIREYALEKLIESGEIARLRDRHLDVFVGYTEESEPKLYGAYQQLWMTWLEGELDNLRAALAWSLESGQIEAGLRLANAISEFWFFRSHQREGRTWFERLLDQAGEDVPALPKARANSIFTHISWQIGDHAAGKAQAEAGMALAKQAGDEGKFTLVLSMLGLANNLRATGDYAAAFDVGQRCLQITSDLSWRSAEVLAIQGINAMALEKNDLGHQLLDEALSLMREQGNTHRRAGVLKILGDLTRCERAYAEARQLYEQSLSIYRDLDATLDAAGVLIGLAHSDLHLGQVERAHTFLIESLSSQRALGNERGIAECLLGFGALAAIRELPAQAVHLLTAAVTWAAVSILDAYPGERLAYRESLAAAQAELTDQAFNEAQRKGRALTLDQAIELALSLPLAPSTALPETQDEIGGLTPREREVAALIARGKSNGEIADELVLSKRTVEKHIGGILSKLEMTSRAQIVRWAIEQGLTTSP